MDKSKSLKESFERGVISKEEYKKEQKKIEKKKGNKQKKEEEHPNKEITKKPDKILIITMSLVLIFIITFFFFINLKPNTRPKTIDELHQINLEKDLPEEQGYIYNGLSFVKMAGLWHTEILSPSGRRIYGLSLHFGPKELEDIKVAGTLNNALFNSEDDLYVTFDPLDKNLQYVALAIGEFDQNIIKSFSKTPVAACTKNETGVCKARPIITCENTNKPVVYFKQDEKTLVTYKNNCITVQGQDIEITRATDRMLMQFYGIME